MYESNNKITGNQKQKTGNVKNINIKLRLYKIFQSNFIHSQAISSRAETTTSRAPFSCISPRTSSTFTLLIFPEIQI